MSQAKTGKIQKNMKYVREQLTRFMKAKYKVDVDYKMYASKDIGKHGRYCEIDIPERFGQGEVEIGIDYETLLKGNRMQLLDIARRNAIQIARWYTGFGKGEDNPIIKEDYARFGVTDYGGVAEQGMELHEYRCSACNKLYILKKKKLLKSKDPIHKGLKTICCRVEFKYNEGVFYDNKKLQYISRKTNIEEQ